MLIAMPGISGISVCRQTTSDHDTSHVCADPSPKLASFFEHTRRWHKVEHLHIPHCFRAPGCIDSSGSMLVLSQLSKSSGFFLASVAAVVLLPSHSNEQHCWQTRLRLGINPGSHSSLTSLHSAHSTPSTQLTPPTPPTFFS